MQVHNPHHAIPRKPITSLIGTVAFCVLAPPVVHADNYLEMNLEQLLKVTVTGSTLRDESLKTAPSSVTVFKREQLDALGFDYLYELMNMVPGFQVNRAGDTPGNYTYSARGRRLGARSREILLVVDGRVFSDPRSGGADSAVMLYPLSNIEKIEIIRGPGSAIYGSGAYTGVINIISRREENRLAVAAGSDERRKVDVNLSRYVGDWSFDLYAHAYEDAGQDYHLASGMNTQDPRREALISLNAGYDKTRVQFFNSYLAADDFYVLEKVANDFNYANQLFRHFRVEQALAPTDNLNTTASLAYYKVRQELHGTMVAEGRLFELSDPASTEPMLGKVLLAGEAYRAEVTNDLTLNENSSVQFGAEWRHERETDARARINYNLEQLVAQDFPIDFYGNFDYSAPVSEEKSRNVSGVYGQFLHNLTDKTRLTLGGRFDYYEQVGDHFSPRIALVHQLNDHHTLKLLYGEAFRAPSFAESNLLNNPVLFGNPNLKNETVATWELIWMGTWDNLNLGSSVFRSDYRDPISTGLQGTTRTFVNGPDESNYGMSVRMDWQLTPNWLMRISHARTEDLSDSAFREADKLNVFMLNYSRNKWNWNLAANYQGQREYPLTQNERATLDSHWLINSQIRYQLQTSVSLSLMAKNLNDEDYAGATQGTGVTGGIPNRGREWQLGAEWDF